MCHSEILEKRDPQHISLLQISWIVLKLTVLEEKNLSNFIIDQGNHFEEKTTWCLMCMYKDIYTYKL